MDPTVFVVIQKKDPKSAQVKGTEGLPTEET